MLTRKYTIFERVRKFNADAGTQLDNEDLSLETWTNEVNMLQEELDELREEVLSYEESETDKPVLRQGLSRIEVADALGDIIYVAMGTMAKLGINYEMVMDAICTSNESKYTDGKLVKNEQGKILKGTNFKAPDLSFVNDKASQEAVKNNSGMYVIPVSGEDTENA